ncbi:MAG: GNAT family N-acetyltransferase [Armatimonadetes bacterium]|nr:GNAT family N-acetyltransferase [Armatimonadota bacterium]
MMNGPRACTRSELAQLVRLSDQVFRPAGGSMEAEYPLVFGEENLPHCRVVTEDGRVVSHVGVSIRDASILGCSLRVASIGAVCTHPDYRGRGYASALMEDARTLALGEGAVLMLISGGRGLYHRLGYVTVGAFSGFSAGLDQLPELPAGLHVAPCGPEHIPALIGLYQQRPVRFIRPAEDWAKLLTAQMLMNRPADCLGLFEGAELVAYAGTQRPAPGSSGPEVVPRIREYAGAETVLFAGLSGIAAWHGASRVEVAIMPGSQDLPRLLRQAGATEEATSFPGTLAIIEPDGFFVCIHEYVRERLGTVADELLLEPRETTGVSFQLGSERYELETLGQLTALVFGGTTAEARQVPPPPPRLGAVLRQLFPLPLLWYGYNYV